ncbi:Bug family tripartite tricarboxylate transporter substrate binding protein [Rhodoferax sediminis]|uniref:Tripartite tricarboxylate transporter substrate binding protein n=1 Tax=Rhodoferax sediminis TaxID=2509614 RepID=A0A515DE47_9BURK|nr:tripartite tricarboxylate transporter substrate-binding protein [Rhodoferax sediminis]QDL38667.1 tripartite tricarboxylate transporter substrate binding protein [Rhodoferax sediminis]
MANEAMNDPRQNVARDMGSRRRSIALCLATLLLFLPGLGVAQSLGAKPIKLVVGFTPGVSADFVVRMIAPRIAEALGPTVVVENKPGASGTIAGAFVAKSPPDDTTLLMGSASPVVISPQTLQKVPFNPLTDLVAINTVGLTPQVIAVNPPTGIITFKYLLAMAHAHQVSLASSGTGGMTHLAIEPLIRSSGSNIVHVPYKGAGPSITDTLAGHVQGVVSDLTPVLPFLQDGRVLAVAVTSEKRVEFLPDVPAVSEDIPGLGATNWAGVLAPGGTPRPVVDRINAALVSVVIREDVKTPLRKAGFVPTTMASPEAFQRFVAQDYGRWGKLIRELNIVTNDCPKEMTR